MEILLLDVGNTAIKYLVTRKDTFKAIRTGYIDFNELQKLKRFENLPTYVSSVKPSINRKLKEIFPHLYFFSLKDCKRLMKIEYKSPTLGIDRVLTCIGGLDYKKDNFACFNFGTATTVNIVLNKTFIGGAIFLGLQKELECLSAKAEQLPLLDIENSNLPPIGNTTESNILGGVFYKHLFAAEGYIELIREKYRIKTVLVSGGLGEIFAKRIKGVIYDPILVFKGMFKLLQDKENINQVEETI
jgi:type III pantothenate kinase